MDAVSKCTKQLSRRDPTLKWINLNDKQLTDAQLAELADCLLAHPDVVTRVSLGGNELTDETGIKLARYVAASSTIQTLGPSHNQFGSATYLALAAALRVNSSLRYLHLHGNQAVDRTRINAAFVEALRLNTDRSIESIWYLCDFSVDFRRLQNITHRSSPSSMLEFLLYVHLDMKKN